MKKYKRFEDQYIEENSILKEMIIIPDNYANLIKDKLVKFHDKNEFLNLDDLIVALNSYFINEKIKFIKSSKNLKFDSGMSSAGYQPKTDELLIFYNDCILDAFKIYNVSHDIENFKWFLSDFYEAIGHETIHRIQMLKDKTKKVGIMYGENEKKHLAQPKEIMAYAWLIVQVYKMYGKTDEFIQDILKSSRTQSNIGIINSVPVFNKYYNMFDKNSTVIKLLYKYMYQYIDQ